MPTGVPFRPGPWLPRGLTATTFTQVDVVAPVTVFISETATRVSTVTGFDVTTVSWTANEAIVGWQIREVANADTTIATAGVIVASGGTVAAGVQQDTVINAAALSSGDGAKLLKIFAQDPSGNWTT